jgi:SAM-dependent methyltransferase
MDERPARLSALRRLAGRLSVRNPVPPRRLWPLSESFVGSGERDLRFLIEEAGLLPHERVLDVGCGLGRLALPLRRYLDENGRYEGFDVREEAVRWARRRVARRDRRLRFRHIDVFNGSYNPSGSVRPSELRFPYADGAFDLVVLFSIFTHMVADDLRHYLAQIARVLAPGGRSMATFRLMDRPETVTTPEAVYEFSHDFGDFLAAHATVPERAVAYREAFVREAYAAAGLEVSSIHYRGRQPVVKASVWQDAVIAVRG